MEKNNLHNHQNSYHLYPQHYEHQSQRQLQLQHHLPTMIINNVNQGAGGSEFTVDREKFFRDLPPGYRFCPTEEELIVQYLRNKDNQLPLPIDIIPQVDLYKYSPEELTGMYNLHRENVWYFFTARFRKYPKGCRPSRSTGGNSGYWKPTGNDKNIYDKAKNIVGYRKVLDYYEKKSPKQVKTDWKMYEYRIEKNNEPPKNTGSGNSMKMDGFVLCKVYKNPKIKNNNNEGDAEENNSGANVAPVEEDGVAEENNNGGNVAPVEESNSAANVLPVEEGGDAEENNNGGNVAPVEDSGNAEENNNAANAAPLKELQPYDYTLVHNAPESSNAMNSNPGTFTDSRVDAFAGRVYDEVDLQFYAHGCTNLQLINEANMQPLPMKHRAIMRETNYATQRINHMEDSSMEMMTTNNASLALPISSDLPIFPTYSFQNVSHDQGADLQGFQDPGLLGMVLDDYAPENFDENSSLLLPMSTDLPPFPSDSFLNYGRGGADLPDFQDLEKLGMFSNDYAPQNLYKNS